jgi:hypothetical protein
MGLRRVPDIKTYWLTDRQSQYDFDFDFVLRASVETTEEYEIDVLWPPACENVSPEAEERPLLEAVTKQHSDDRDWEH